MDNLSTPLGAGQKLLPIGDLFKKSFEFYKSKLYEIMVLALIRVAEFDVISFLLEIIHATEDKIFALVIGLVIFLVFVFSLVTNVWVQITIFYLIKEENTVSTAKDLLIISWKKIASFSWVLFLMGIITGAGFLLLIVPGI